MSIKNRGLPNGVKMRHNGHYVEDVLSGYSSDYQFRLIALDEIMVNEEQPRQDFGDLDGLVSSIRKKGVLEPILVRRAGDMYSIISGERRYHAATRAELASIPAIILEADDLETLEIALIENIQRKDLTPFEEADGYGLLIERFKVTHEEIAERIGRSRINITETLTLRRIPDALRELCREKKIKSKTVLIEIARQETPEEMLELINEIVTKGLSRGEIRDRRRSTEPKKEGKPKPFVFKFKPKAKDFSLNLRFKKENVSPAEIIRTLEEIISILREK